MALTGMLDFAPDEVFHALAQGHRCHQQFPEFLLLGETREVVEQLHQILTKLWSGGEQPEVGVKARGF